MKNIILILLLLLCTSCFAQDTLMEEINKITLELHLAKRGDHELVVNLKKEDSVTIVSLTDNFSLSKDTTFEISNDKFNAILKSIIKIKTSDLFMALYCGLDGMSSTITVGNYGSHISYKVWAANAYIKERKLEDYFNACVLILTTAKIDPAKYKMVLDED